jgi:hypothetical protein
VKTLLLVALLTLGVLAGCNQAAAPRQASAEPSASASAGAPDSDEALERLLDNTERDLTAVGG